MIEFNQLFAFIGVGVRGLKGLSKEVIHLLFTMDRIYLENYTNYTDNQFNEFKNHFGNRLMTVDRAILENNSKIYLKDQLKSRTALIISGDPFIATTHYMLYLEAQFIGLRVIIYNNSSIYSLAPSLTGLSAYKFGKTVTLPFLDRIRSNTPYDIIKENLKINAHTLVLLDIDVPNNDYISVTKAIKQLYDLETKNKSLVITENTLIIGLSNIGFENSRIHAGSMSEVVSFPWDEYGPPQAVIICAPLQAAENEALNAFWMKKSQHPIINFRPAKILVTGTFDILHPGHLAFFAKVRALKIPSELWVIVARDSSVQEFKKRAPILSEKFRLDMLNALEMVDHAILGNEGPDKIKIVEKIRPDILALGYDQWINPKKLQLELERRGLDTKVVQMEKYGDLVYSSSSKIREKIINSIND